MAALVAAGALVLVVVASVLTFGVVRPPQLDRITQGPPVAGAVAWTQWEGERMCVMTAAPDGEVTSVRCDRDYADLIAWTDEGIIIRRWSGSGSEVVIDPVSGQVIESRAIPEDAEPIYPGAITSYHEDGMLIVEDLHTGDELWRISIASVYGVHGGTASPDGRWIAAGDSARRLLVFDRESDAGPRVWATDVDPGWMVVWQGAETTEPVG
ncbi:MAG: hypothetical protein WD358_09195 [Nitriliruptoraceae bacterium]